MDGEMEVQVLKLHPGNDDKLERDESSSVLGWATQTRDKSETPYATSSLVTRLFFL